MVAILSAICERWATFDLFVRNLAMADKPSDCCMIARLQGTTQFIKYAKKKLAKIRIPIQTIDASPPQKLIDHEQLRDNRAMRDIQLPIINQAYLDLQQAALDVPAERYWIIEDDILFPLNVYHTYDSIMNGLWDNYESVPLLDEVHAVSGVSYSGILRRQTIRPFWTFNVTKIFGPNDSSQESLFSSKFMAPQETGIVRLGGAGLNCVLCTRKALETWHIDIHGGGPDIQFFYQLQEAGLAAYGIWDVKLVHMTRGKDGTINILGQCDPSILRVLGVSKEALRYVG